MTEYLYVAFFALGIGTGYLLANKKVIVQKAEAIQEQRERKKAEIDNTEIIVMKEPGAEEEKEERKEDEYRSFMSKQV